MIKYYYKHIESKENFCHTFFQKPHYNRAMAVNSRVYDADGGIYRYRNGLLHCEDKPALELSDDYIAWYYDGNLHRLDGPAIEGPDNDKFWYQNNKLHREDGPAIERKNGIKWYLNGELHRKDGPAIEHIDGYKAYYRHGKYNYFQKAKQLFLKLFGY